MLFLGRINLDMLFLGRLNRDTGIVERKAHLKIRRYGFLNGQWAIKIGGNNFVQPASANCRIGRHRRVHPDHRVLKIATPREPCRSPRVPVPAFVFRNIQVLEHLLHLPVIYFHNRHIRNFSALPWIPPLNKEIILKFFLYNREYISSCQACSAITGSKKKIQADGVIYRSKLIPAPNYFP